MEKTFAKIDVNGESLALYAHLEENSIKWNSSKFLVDKHGKAVARYALTYKPEKLEEDILKLIKEQ